MTSSFDSGCSLLLATYVRTLVQADGSEMERKCWNRIPMGPCKCLADLQKVMCIHATGLLYVLRDL